MGLGNPGPRYDATRHNVGWWVLDRLAHDWKVGPFRQEGPALVASGSRGSGTVLLLKPTTWMNRSGAALSLLPREGFAPEEDLLVVVDDAALEVGRVRFRPGGSAGGHNGLRSVQGVLGHDRYARLRVGVGRNPPGSDLVQWVLSPMPEEDEDVVLALFPLLVEGIGVWVEEGIQQVMNRFNR